MQHFLAANQNLSFIDLPEDIGCDGPLHISITLCISFFYINIYIYKPDQQNVKSIFHLASLNLVLCDQGTNAGLLGNTLIPYLLINFPATWKKKFYKYKKLRAVDLLYDSMVSSKGQKIDFPFRHQYYQQIHIFFCTTVNCCANFTYSVFFFFLFCCRSKDQTNPD